MKDYSKKLPEWRKIWLIGKTIERGKCLDLGCGPGEYGPKLRERSSFLFGVDIDDYLLEIAKNLKVYDGLQKMDVNGDLPFTDNSFDYVWASEILEHLPDLNIIRKLEKISKKKIVITMPNPFSPHFRKDKNHILRYSVKSLKDFLKKRKGWTYKIRGLGFDGIPAPLFLKRLTTYFLYFLPELSPTIAVIGERVSDERKD
ncbi:MAG: class I SAM-dependent methyltransferase [Candidatus Omnitrophota bacterium]